MIAYLLELATGMYCRARMPMPCSHGKDQFDCSKCDQIAIERAARIEERRKDRTIEFRRHGVTAATFAFEEWIRKAS